VPLKNTKKNKKDKEKEEKKMKKTYLFLNYITSLHKILINMLALEINVFKIWHL